MSNFVQGNPVYDFDHNDYVGAYVQDEWKLRPNLTLNVGVRWEPYLAIKNTNDYVSNFDQARFDAGITQHRLSAGAGRAAVPRRRRIPGIGGHEQPAGCSSRRGRESSGS